MKTKIKLGIYKKTVQTKDEKDYSFNIMVNGKELEYIDWCEALGSGNDWDIELSCKGNVYRREGIRGTFRDVTKYIENHWTGIRAWLMHTLKKESEIIQKDMNTLIETIEKQTGKEQVR